MSYEVLQLALFTNDIERVRPIEKIVSPLGWQLVAAVMQKQPIQWVLEQKVELILLDLDIPNSIHLTSSLNRCTPNVPILVVTSEDSLHKLQDAMAAGAKDFITYPINAKHLMASLHRAIGERTSTVSNIIPIFDDVPAMPVAENGASHNGLSQNGSSTNGSSLNGLSQNGSSVNGSTAVVADAYEVNDSEVDDSQADENEIDENVDSLVAAQNAIEQDLIEQDLVEDEMMEAPAMDIATETEFIEEEFIEEELFEEELVEEQSVSIKAPPINRSHINRAPLNRAPINKAPASRVHLKRAPISKASGSKIAGSKIPSNRVAANREAPVRQAPASQAPASERPVNKAPVDKAPVREAPEKQSKKRKAPEAIISNPTKVMAEQQAETQNRRPTPDEIPVDIAASNGQQQRSKPMAQPTSQPANNNPAQYQQAANHTGSMPSVQGKTTAIVGLRGGIGRSTIATNLAIALSQKNAGSVTIVEAHHGLSNQSLMLQLRPQRTLATIQNERTIDYDIVRGYLQQHTSGINVLSAPTEIDDMVELDSETWNHLLNITAGLSSHTIIDTSSAADSALTEVLMKADEILVVTDPDIASLRSATSLYQNIYREPSIGGQMRLIVNRSGITGGLDEKTIQKQIGQEVFVSLPHDSSLTTYAMNRGIPFVLSHPRSILSKRINELADKLIQPEEGMGHAQFAHNKPAEKSSFMSFLGR